MNLKAKKVWTIFTPKTITFATGDTGAWDPDDGCEPPLETKDQDINIAVDDFETEEEAMQALVETHKETHTKFKRIPDKQWGGTKLIADGLEEVDVPDYPLGSYVMPRIVLVDADL